VVKDKIKTLKCIYTLEGYVMEKAYELFQKLPDDLKREVIDYIEFLLEKKAKKKHGQLGFTWKGALKNMKDKYSSVELQHKALEWWG